MDELLFIEAVNCIGLKDSQRKKITADCRGVKRRGFKPQWMGAACASLLVVFGMMLWIEPMQKSTGCTGEDSAESAVLDVYDAENMSQITNSVNETGETVPANLIRVNEIVDSIEIGAARIDYSEEEYQRVTWTWERVEEYYGRELKVDPLPEDMILNPFCHQQEEVILERATGKIVEDTVWLEYWNDWQDYENGGVKRMVWEGGRGFTVLVSKLGILQCGILVSEEDMEVSIINGVEVLIGHRVLGTLYNENHEPEFEYDVYQAQFTYDGAEYEVTTNSMTLDELVAVVESLILK